MSLGMLGRRWADAGEGANSMISVLRHEVMITRISIIHMARVHLRTTRHQTEEHGLASPREAARVLFADAFLH